MATENLKVWVFCVGWVFIHRGGGKIYECSLFTKEHWKLWFVTQYPAIVCTANHHNICFHVKYFIYNLQPSSLFTGKEEPWGLWVVTQYPAHTLSYPDSLSDRLPRESSKQEYLRRRNSFATWFQSFPTLIFWVAGYVRMFENTFSGGMAGKLKVEGQMWKRPFAIYNFM